MVSKGWLSKKVSYEKIYYNLVPFDTHHTSASAKPATPPAIRCVLRGTFSLPPVVLGGGDTLSPVMPPPKGLDVVEDIRLRHKWGATDY